MLDIHKRTGFLFLGVMMAQVILVSAQVQTKTGTRALQAVSFEVFSRVESGTASMVRGSRNVWGDYFALRGTRTENEALRQRVAALEVKLQEEHALAVRSQQLQALMDLKTGTDLPTIAAEVIAGNPDPLMRTLTIDRGSADGVQADMAVIAPGGVVGRIVGPVARRASRVQLLVDPNAAAGGLIERTRTAGLVVGGEGNPTLRMDMVSNLADVKPGDSVVASGVDGIYPRGYGIGKIEKAERGSGLNMAITVRPGVDFGSLEEVLVVLVPSRSAVRDEAAK